MTLVPSYASIRPDESGPHVGFTWIWDSAVEWLCFPQGAHLILVTVVFSMPHQDLVILFPIRACMAIVTRVLTQASLDLDTLCHTWAYL